MKYMHAEWRSRLEHWIHTLKQDLYIPLGKIEFEGFLTRDHLSPAQAMNGSFVPMPEGRKWGHSYEYCWLKSKITLPENASGHRIAMDLKTGGEATLFVDGLSFGTYRADWISDAHHYICDNYLTTSAEAGTSYDLLIESYAGHFYPQSELGGCATGPVLPGSYQDPKTEGERATIGNCTYGIWNEDAYQLYMDVSTLSVLANEVDPESLRAEKINDALKQFMLIVDFEQAFEGRVADYRKARKALSPALKAVNGSTAPVFYAIGNAHIDIAWLWPIHETERKVARTFAAQLRLLDEYPDYKYIQSQPAAYEMCKQHYPELYARIKEAIKEGRWIAEGAMWVEPDTNMTSGESLIRQVTYGKRYFKDEFDVDSVMLWLPDTFGYSAVLPQILKSCGIRYLVTQKIFWSYNDGERFPYHYFTWQGSDGSQVDSFLPTSYTYRTNPNEVNSVWKNRTQKNELDAFLFPFGYGDGGGGPCRDYIEFAVREKNLEGMPKVKMENPLTFFKDMEKEGGPQHRYVGELYFSAHRGVYTSQAGVKKGNRKGEIALREAEMWLSAASMKGLSYPTERMDTLWKCLLTNQFHDILPGSCIGIVYERTAKEYAHLQSEVSDLLASAQAAMGSSDQGVSVFNSLSFERSVVVELPDYFAQGAVTTDGEIIPTTVTQNGVLANLLLPSCGAVRLYPAEKNQKIKAVTAKASKNAITLENSLVKVKINMKGEVTSFVDKESGREFAASPMNHFLLYKDVPRLFDAWDIDSNYILQPVDIDTPVSVTLHMESDLRAIVRVERKISESTLSQDIVLDAESRRLDFKTHVDWNEMHRLLKVSFPVDVYAEQGINEIQFGYMERPTHRSRPYDSDRFEVCNQRYSALCDESHGAALLNDCKYGISMNDNELQLTLLRAATSPEMRADNGPHDFTYSFTAWDGPFLTAPVVQEAYALNVPALVSIVPVDDFSMFTPDEANIFIDTVKPADDGSGDLIVRLYEAKKADTTCTLGINLDAKSIYECSMMEENLSPVQLEEGCVSLHFRPFEIKTLRVVL